MLLPLSLAIFRKCQAFEVNSIASDARYVYLHFLLLMLLPLSLDISPKCRVFVVNHIVSDTRHV